MDKNEFVKLIEREGWTIDERDKHCICRVYSKMIGDHKVEIELHNSFMKYTDKETVKVVIDYKDLRTSDETIRGKMTTNIYADTYYGFVEVRL